MKIVTQQAGVRINLVRYYERKGLLPLSARQASGHRGYASPDISRLRMGRRAKAVGFTLEEICGLLKLSGRREDDLGGLKPAATEKLADVQTNLAELGRIRDGLQALIATCPGYGALNRFPILNALDEDQI